eukprot:TRINITY_DN3763_c0_g1_i4.p1 TRINITY_DN3763_c0_g1~~TRINITY_DN3763_c0_g1_i4.p1  ORF type:complete len:132 (+),score=15.09 TRINITY_DN3763_c0_g1_i4:578-973(+)
MQVIILLLFMQKCVRLCYYLEKSDRRVFQAKLRISHIESKLASEQKKNQQILSDLYPSGICLLFTHYTFSNMPNIHSEDGLVCLLKFDTHTSDPLYNFEIVQKLHRYVETVFEKYDYYRFFQKLLKQTNYD